MTTPIRKVRLRGEIQDYKSISRRHPWFFSGAFVPSDLQRATPGGVVEVITRKGVHVGTGYYETGGGIAVRMLSYGEKIVDLDDDFFAERIRTAYAMRQALGLVGASKGYRLVHGEGDGLPGLVIDVYSGLAVMQAHTIGMAIRRDKVARALRVVLGSALNGVYYKSEGTLHHSSPGGDMQELLTKDTLLFGEIRERPFEENGVLFMPDVFKGQKTGFFLDQRENRLLLKRYSEGKRVLNMFCYTGGFSLQALAGGASEVTSVDSSEQAIALLEKNLSLNESGFTQRHTSVVGDAFRFLDEMPKERYDIVVLDPPAFAKNRSALSNALQGYRRLNALALSKMPSGSILFTFSCSQVVTVDLFRQTLFTAALQAKRNVRILHILTQATDHLVSIYHPEGEYLKGLVLYVE